MRDEGESVNESVSLLFGVHAHQPIGNFPKVLEDAHQRCYRPFLQTLHRFPEFRFAMHFSGWLLDYLSLHHPNEMALLKEMVARGQAELFGGGEYEPVLAAIPTRDRIGQIHALSGKLHAKFGQRPHGAWLTERVWEATVVPALADSGVRYVTVDDYHFLCTGRTTAELNGYFTTEEDGRTLDLFPISEALRYKLPFSPAPDAVAYLESLAQDGAGAAAIYFDDIEKFGIWPETYQWVYEKGWLTQFIQGVLASERIVTQKYHDYHGANRTRGVVYLPTASYIEMNEWTLPAEAAHVYAGLVQEAKQAGRFDRDKAFLRGGIWRNFLSRYPEANWMHKRMLGLSRRVAGLDKEERTPEMLDRLYQAQANDPYWHGLFGGLYLPHLRRAVYSAIVALEAMLDRVAPRPPKLMLDVDMDGLKETFLQNGIVQAVIDGDGSAAIREFDSYRLEHNFGDTLRRQAEHYYRKIRLGTGAEHNREGIASAHDRLSFKHDIGPEDLLTDDYGRELFVDRLDGAIISGYHVDPAADDESMARFSTETGPLRVRKQIALIADRMRVVYRFDGERNHAFSTEINLAMPSCDGWGGRYIREGGIPGGFGEPLRIDGLTGIVLDDDTLGGSVTLLASCPVVFRAQPHFTVSQSEDGFEKIMQAVTIVLEWLTGVGEMAISLEINSREKRPHE